MKVWLTDDVDLPMAELVFEGELGLGYAVRGPIEVDDVIGELWKTAREVHNMSVSMAEMLYERGERDAR